MIKLLLITLLSLSLFALDINEAIQRAMLNNPGLKEKKHLSQASHEETNIARSEFRPTLDLSYEYNQFSQKNFVGADSASAAGAAIGYNLFNGFADSFNLKASEEDENAARYIHEASKADLRFNVYLSYIDYLRSQEQITVAQKTINLLEQQLQDAKNFYEQGLFAKNDYLQVDVELSSAQQALLGAKRNINIAFLNLKRLLGSELLRHEKIEDISRQYKEVHMPQLKMIMLDNRSELKLLNAQRRGLDHLYEAAAANYYPKVDAEIKYQVAGEDPLPNGGATFQIHDQTSAGINLAWNLYNGGADESKRASLLHKKSAGDERLHALYLELDFQLEQALASYELAKNQIRVSEKALEQAKENYRITNDQFSANISSTSLMLDAQRFLARTQVDYYSAYFALYDAMAEIERVVEKEIF